MLNNQSALVQSLLGAMDLSDAQLQELFHPETRVMKDEAFAAMAAFFQNAQRLILCGDYDCDGVSSTSLAYLLAVKLGIDVGYYIPDRLKEGYGVRESTIQMAFDKGYTDVVLIDNGVKSFAEIALAKRLGMRIAIIDHHLITEDLPVDALLHPDVLGPYGSSMCAAGLVYALSEFMGLDDDYMLALAALATVGDVMPLWGKNRELVRRGVVALERNQFLQFDLLVKRNRFTTYSAKLLAFQIVPKVNSVGRLADRANVNTCVKYFVSNDDKVIHAYALQMLDLNAERKSLGKSYFDDALKLTNEDAIQIIVNDHFHEGLLGIVANQVLQATQKPSLVLRRYDEVIKGSARSNSISLDTLFSQLDSKFFKAFGGHDFAFGMSLDPQYFEEFKEACLMAVEKMPSMLIETQSLTLDPRLVTKASLDNLRMFEPFGAGFELPLLRLELPKDFRVSEIKGHGFKFSFTAFPIEEAVYFTQNYSIEAMKDVKTLLGSLDLGSNYRVSFFVEDII